MRAADEGEAGPSSPGRLDVTPEVVAELVGLRAAQGRELSLDRLGSFG